MELREISQNGLAYYEGESGEPNAPAVGLNRGDNIISPISGSVAALSRYEESYVISIVNGTQICDIFYIVPTNNQVAVGSYIQKGTIIGTPARVASSGRLYCVLRCKINGVAVPYSQFPTNAIAYAQPEVDAYSQNMQVPQVMNAQAYIGADGSIQWNPPVTTNTAVPASSDAAASADPTKITLDGNSNVLWIALIGIVVVGLVLALKNRK